MWERREGGRGEESRTDQEEPASVRVRSEEGGREGFRRDVRKEEVEG